MHGKRATYDTCRHSGSAVSEALHSRLNPAKLHPPILSSPHEITLLRVDDLARSRFVRRPRGTYPTKGAHLLLRVDQDTEVLDLKRKGNTLEGKIDGDLLTFVRK
jgi:hypothetical protein